jgi:hypothetical protein
VKKAIGVSPFEMVYGSQARLPLSNLLPVHRFLLEEDLDDPEPMMERMNQLMELDEIRAEAHKKNLKMQQQSKYLFDKRTTERKFRVNDLVLQWNARKEEKGKHGKFESLWMGPFVIQEFHGQDSYFLEDPNGEIQELPVHGQFLKHYFS